MAFREGKASPARGNEAIASRPGTERTCLAPYVPDGTDFREEL